LTRRRFLGLHFTGGLALGVSAGAQRRPSTSSRPNVLMLIADDLNTWTGLQHPGSAALTPHLNRLGQSGVVFRNAYCASPLCNPSRSSTLTGIAPWKSGVYDNGHWWKPALPNTLTMPMFWRSHGYHAAGAGKVFHHTAGFNPPSQWDEFHPFAFDDPWDRPAENYPQVPRTQTPPDIPLNGIKPMHHEFDWGSLPKSEQEYGDARTVRWAQQFLSQQRAQPFFLTVGLFRPHLPWYVPPEYFEATAGDSFAPPRPPDDLDDLPKAGRQMAAAGARDYNSAHQAGKWKEAVAAYRASIRYADELFGRVLQALADSPHAANTIVVFWSDNGFHLGEKQRFHKSTLWERASRVPLVITAPGVKPAVVDTPVSLLDVYPTLAALCGLQTPQGLDGEDRTSILRNPKQLGGKPAITNFQPGNYAVSDTRWRYIRYRDGGEELYDLGADPAEWKNLAGQPAQRQRIAQMAKWIPTTEAPPVPGKSAYRFDPVTYSWELKPSP
jgi:arylsulfatase A-like enzyme